jgi:AmmeMemoRadiSam system protein B/AmmeMemoRadiSam system protein A
MVTQRRMLLLLPLLLLGVACSAQQRQVDRQPAVAGQFYPGNPEELRQSLDDFFANAVPRNDPADVVALIVPHAGYVYSGQVAASGFNQIDPHRKYDNIFVIGTSHHLAFEGASVYCSGDFVTPLGTVKVNRSLGEDLIRKDGVFSSRTDVHLPEHSLEVQLPFLQTRLKKPFQIVPILLGTSRPETCRKIAAALRPFFSEKNLFVISSDFSHYPPYDAAVRVDRATADAIVSKSPDVLMHTLQQNAESGTPGLETSLCGWSSVLTLLYLTSLEKDIEYHAIQYKNSGDALAGNKQSVVGYYAIVATRGDPPAPSSFGLTTEEKATLLALARGTVEACVSDLPIPTVKVAELSKALTTPCGAFVTLTKRGNLRGCIGRFNAQEPLWEVIQQMSIASATQDPRFEPVVSGELRDIEIEISVLSPMRKITSIDEIELGRHGIYIRKGARSGTFLPQVAEQTGWTKEEFLGHCAQDKAGIGWEGWKDADLYIYEALVFSEKGHTASP